MRNAINKQHLTISPADSLNNVLWFDSPKIHSNTIIGATAINKRHGKRTSRNQAW